MNRQASLLLDWVLMLGLTASLPGCGIEEEQKGRSRP